ncbi:LacI family DNA-binding transcriptional regulator [Thiospirochaeta perfilievii]|nr:substrate-binding domain-containing protein [Thiospirochaeta perfilievii]
MGNGLDFSEEFLVSGDYSIKSGFDSMNELLDRNLGITAVFAVNDMMAIGAAKAVLTKGLDVPGDISIVGYDGLDYGKYFNPSLTTVKQPNADFVRSSCDILLGIIERNSKTRHIVLETRFIERESCKRVN